MRILSGVGHEGLEGYIRDLEGILVLDVAADQETLVDMASDGYDLLLVSRELAGSLKPEQLINALKSKGCGNLRIAFLYGEYDDLCDCFIEFLMENRIYDFHVGGSITSKDIHRILFRAMGKASAIGYMESRYEYAYYDGLIEHSHRSKGALHCGIAAIGHRLKQFIHRDGSKPVLAGRPVVSIISNQATGKSHTAWNLASCLSGYGYSTSLLNIDRGYSANLFFGIADIYHSILDFKLQNDEINTIMDVCYKRKKLSVITGKPGEVKEISEADFTKLLYTVRTKSEATIIDTPTGISALTRLSVRSSDCDLLVFDCDLRHYHMNLKMLEELREDFVPDKTIAVINNTNVKAPGHKRIYNSLSDSGIPFRDIAFIDSCGLLSSELMSTGLSPYNSAREESIGLKRDIDDLLIKLSGT